MRHLTWIVLLCSSAAAQPQWVQIPATSAPAARRYTAGVFDLVSNTLLVFGGQRSTGTLADTWAWNGRSWAQRTPKTSPPPRQHHAMAYDSARQRTVLFGGESSGGKKLADTWEWDGKDWKQLTPKNNPYKQNKLEK